MAIKIEDDVSLVAAGLPAHEVRQWLALEPIYRPPTGTREPADWFAELQAASRFFIVGQTLLDRLPARPRRSEQDQAAAEALNARLREVRTGFLRRYAERLYRRLTDDYRTFVRIEELVYLAADAAPGL